MMGREWKNRDRRGRGLGEGPWLVLHAPFFFEVFMSYSRNFRVGESGTPIAEK